jgi:hypothetical protein
LKHSLSYLILFLFLCSSVCACSQDTASAPQIKQHVYKLGTKELAITETNYQISPPVQFLQLHHNESTAEEVTKKISHEMGINFLQIMNGEKRLVDFTLQGKKYRFDPNRMFSTEGIVASLKIHSQYSEAGFQTIASFRDFLLLLLPPKNTIVAVHNNSDGNFSLIDYQKNKTGLVHLNPLHDPDDFFITTDSLLFNKLREKNYNAVLEYSTQLKDDGSLSIYCSRNRVSYVNVEAEHGHKDQQEEMLRALIEILK